MFKPAPLTYTCPETGQGKGAQGKGGITPKNLEQGASHPGPQDAPAWRVKEKEKINGMLCS